MNEITTVGLDLAKNVFQVHGVDAEGTTVLRKQLRRALSTGRGISPVLGLQFSPFWRGW